MNILNKTKTYLVGHMQYSNGSDWRKYVKQELTPLNIQCFYPYDKPFLKDVEEGDHIREKFKQQMENGEFDDVQAHMREIRSYDLNLVDRCDFVIAHLIPQIASWGSAEELTTSVRMKKPTFISIEGGKKKCPLWLLGMFPHKYIYDNVDDIISVIKKIDSGEKSIDYERWRLLKPEYR
jgi:nucleoside 2-deoxyribosyltransferase